MNCGEKIRSMTDDELASVFTNIWFESAKKTIESIGLEEDVTIEVTEQTHNAFLEMLQKTT